MARPKNTEICTAKKCDRLQKAKTFCLMHYKRWLKHGDENYEYVISILPCDAADCSGKREQYGLCTKHFYEKYRKQNIKPYLNVKHLYESGNYSEFIEKVKTEHCLIDQNQCWIWQRSRGKDGTYGKLTINHRYLMVHRIMKQAQLGGINLGKDQVHHICANTLCCNPDHLQLLSQRENIAEMQERTYYKNRIFELEIQVLNLQAELEKVRNGG